ncbi:FimV/HubP family polar landmark protein [Marinospirillum alkaliphilum]|uniref:Pilus assembly protein FimV n=1 Tax=Marinospirillum alkaliphilum DSM 21637 TaxID=1122209 RepID=A0A1K1X4A4_9GAMM|nr:FimV/HubP family polar landmark protein [Marinospirillum alkaliphilum]SFX44359.1 pilus assembly protein FimV [Marinospirillum alkaliphilum DSM 21637]
MRSWMVAGLAAGVLAVPLSLVVYSSQAADFPEMSALTAEELRTALASSTATPQAQRRVRVGPRDTLWSIARTNRPDNNITIKQAMLAIRDANPQAFPGGNINEMEAGATLVIPTAAAMMRRTASQAEEEVRRQNQAWVASKAPPLPTAQERQQPAPQVAPAPVTRQPAPAAASAPQPAPERADTRPRDLQLVTPPATDTQQQRIRELESRLASSEEGLQAVEREKDELAERITEMQQQINTLQQLIRLKDEQLADMERQLTQRPAQHVVTPSGAVAPATAEPQDLMAQIQQQPGLYGALGGLAVLVLLMLAALLSTRGKLSKARAEAAEAVRASGNLEADILAAHNATSSDFDLDLNARPLEDLESLGLGNDLSTDLEESDLALDEAVETTAPAAVRPAAREEKQRDPLQEAEMFIAYGRLEQAAGFLQKAIAEQPEREDLRVKLLEVLVELNDEETFRQQQAELEVRQPSSASRDRAAELAGFFATAAAATSLAAASVQETEQLQDEDLGDLDLGDVSFDEDLDLSEQELDDIFAEEDTLNDQDAFGGVEMDLQVDQDQSDLEDLPDLNDLVGQDDIDDLSDLDSLEADLDEVISARDPLEPVDDVGEDLPELDVLDEAAAEELDLDLELDLEKPLADDELADELHPENDFEPVDYKSDAEEFMSALDSLSLDDALDENMEIPGARTRPAPGVEEDLAALSSDLSELESLASDEEPAVDEVDLSGLDDLGGFDDLDLGVNDDMTTQLDLATAYIEMGDKEGAREILEKVVREADADLSATAQQMLEALKG